jgi:hypothetical protein
VPHADRAFVGEYRDDEKRAELQDAMIDHIVRLERALRPFIAGPKAESEPREPVSPPSSESQASGGAPDPAGADRLRKSEPPP